ncbi:MAG: fatty acid desaturase [Anaerolineaceae bacterium]|nr:fatty acid desaturase [Anaerolineaceae bacterium]
MTETRRPPFTEPLPKMSELNKLLAPYQKSSIRHSLWQLANTLLPYFLLWYLMWLSLKVSYALTLALTVIAAGLLVRIFILFHDCGHNSFLPSTKWNKRVGFWLGVLVFTPGEQWWRSHAIHHASSGNLDKRGIGDVTMLTVDEYFESRWFGRLGYRLFRSPPIMFILGPIYMFLLSHRFPLPRYGKRETASVVWTNLAILGLGAGLSLLMGFKAYVMIQFPIIWIAGAAGIWLFYVQHQFEDSYWEREDRWDYVASALLGASYYQLPRLLQWFTGSIGFHHVHHLSPRIPNYNLEPAHENTPVIKKWTRVIRFSEGLKTTRLKLWDEPDTRMIGFTRQPSAAGQRQPKPERAS